MFQRGARGIERGGGGAEHADRLAAEGGEVDRILGVRVARGRQAAGQNVGDGAPAAAGKAGGEDDLARRLGGGAGGGGQVQDEMARGRLDAVEARGVARGDVEKTLVPAQVVGPVGPPDAIDRGVGVLAVARLVPGLEAQRRDAEFRALQALGRAQQVHPRRVQPDAGAGFVGGGLQDGDLADAGAAQREGQRAAGLAPADDGDVVVDAGPVRHPVGGVRADQAQRVPGIGIRIG
ncbi:MAG: hypothetical protein WDN25_23115 [Acetobacteraceae bacterium]